MSSPVHLSRSAGEVAERSKAGEGRAARTVRAVRPSPSSLTRLDLSRAAGEVYF
jgi:hypothetical protein